jgi:hypothetical protein
VIVDFTHTVRPTVLTHSPTEPGSSVRIGFRSVALAAVLVALGGVSGVTGAGAEPKIEKLDHHRTFPIEEGEAKSLDLEAQPGAQTFTVEFSSSKCDVSVYVFKGADVKGEDGLLTSDPKKALASARAKVATFKVDVPEKTATRIIFRGATGETTVAAKITNQLALNTKDAQLKKLEEENAALKKEVVELKKQLEKK